MENTTEQAGPMVLQSTETYPCRKCGKSFPSPNARNMHEMRVHTKAGQRGAMWKKERKIDEHRPGRRPALTPEQKQENKRVDQARMRARNIAKGLTSAGKPRKIALRSSYAGIPRPDEVEKRNEYKRNWYRKNKAKRILAVYPTPGMPAPYKPNQPKTELSDEETMLLSLLMKKHGKSNE